MNLRAFTAMDPTMGPTPAELAGIKPGVFVRLSLSNGSRFWAMCTSKQRDNGTYSGRCETGVPGGPRRGDTVIFCKKHVFEIT